MPEFHVVKKGDTLWSVCDCYFRRPLALAAPVGAEPAHHQPALDFPRRRHPHARGGAPPRPSPPAASGGGRAPDSPQPPGLAEQQRRWCCARLASSRPRIWPRAAVISGSREEKILLSTGDQAYLSFPKDRPLRAGERYTVFVADTEHPVRTPARGDVLGYLVRIYGDIVVDQIADRSRPAGPWST